MTVTVWCRHRICACRVTFRRTRHGTTTTKACGSGGTTAARHDRHGVVSPSNLRVPGDLSTNQTRDDDNDGLWTSMYAAAECFRYAVTHSSEALANATKSTEAVLFLEEVAGKRGFP